MTKWEIEFEKAELLEAVKEQERFERVYKANPSLPVRVCTKEAHLPLLYITSAQNKKIQEK